MTATGRENEETKIPVLTGEGQQIDLTASEIRDRAATDPGLRLVDPAEEENLEPTEENIAALLEWQKQQLRDRETDYDAASDPDYLGDQAEAQFERTASNEERATRYSVYSTRTGEAQEFSTSREAGVAFADADAKDLPSVTETDDRGVRRMAGTVGIGDERVKSIPSLDSIQSDPTQTASDREFWGAYHERMQTQHRDNRELVGAVEDRQALIAEAQDLARRDVLTGAQQQRLTEIVDQTLGREAAQELKAGNTDVLRDFGGREDRIDLAERYLKAEQSQGKDRSAALDAVGKERELSAMDRQADRAQDLDRQDAQLRQRAREDGLER
jgi:hypothetical protein